MSHRLARRSFLRCSAMILAAPAVLRSGVWGAEVSPNDRIELGFIGMGTQGRGLLGNCLRRGNVRVVGVCDVDGDRRENARRMVDDHYAKEAGGSGRGGCHAAEDFRELLARPGLDGVVIATPDHWHAWIGIAAAKAGKDIYCEKPLTQSIREARELVRAVRRHERVLQVGSMQRSSREFRRACQLVRNGAIGKVEEIEVGVGGPGRWCDLPEEAAQPGLNWDLWLGPARWRPYHSELSPRGVHRHFPNWRNYREYGGGMVTDWGAHHFDIAQWAMGMDESGPVEVLPADRPDAQSGVSYRYANGTVVRHVSGNGVTFHGSGGRIRVNRGQFQSNPESLVEIPLTSHAVQLYESNDHIGDWLTCMRTRKRPICDVEVGARTVSVCHLVNLAYWTGLRLKWDPSAERFVGGTGDDAWKDLGYREPWTLERAIAG